MPKVFLLITSLAGGGAERAVSDLSRNFNNSIDCKVVLLSKEISYPVDKDPLSLNLNLQNDRLANLSYQILIGILKYKKIIKREGGLLYSISFLTIDNFINILSNINNKNVVTIVSVHTALSKKFQNTIVDKICIILIKLLYNKADIIVAVSEGVKHELIEKYGIRLNKIRVIYNPVDKDYIQNSSVELIDDEPWYLDDIPIIITVGRLTTAKGHWHLLRAFKKVVNKFKCRLLICGDGDLKPYLQSLIIDLDLGGYAKLIGWKSNPYKYMAQSQIYVSSSLWEALPYALIEAMACGCPVISTDCKYGPAEILKNGKYGIIVPTPDEHFYDSNTPLTDEEEIMAHAILYLLHNQSLREYYSNLSKIRSNEFSLKESLIKYENILANFKNSI